MGSPKLPLLVFECKAGRVTFIDLGAFLAEVRDRMPGGRESLRDRWYVEAVTKPLGAFRLHFKLERARTLVDSVVNGAMPTEREYFSYAVTEWTVEPLTANRGETLEAALKPSSAFRRLADSILPQQAVVTFWVYPDSFGTFRRLRDFLYERNIEVAGRPIPLGVPIAASKHGTASRGQ